MIALHLLVLGDYNQSTLCNDLVYYQRQTDHHFNITIVDTKDNENRSLINASSFAPIPSRQVHLASRPEEESRHRRRL